MKDKWDLQDNLGLLIFTIGLLLFMLIVIPKREEISVPEGHNGFTVSDGEIITLPPGNHQFIITKEADYGAN